MKAPTTNAAAPYATMRDDITAHLRKAGEATAAQITAAINMAEVPSAVISELNAMRTDTLVEAEKKKGKGTELWYWLVRTCDTSESAMEESLTSQIERLEQANAGYSAAVGRIHDICREAGIPAGIVTDRVAGLAVRLEEATKWRDRWQKEATDLARIEDEREKLRSECAEYRSELQCWNDATGCQTHVDAMQLLDKLRADLATERQAREALQEQINAEGVDVLQAMHSVMIEGAGYNGDRRPVRNKLADAVKVGQARVRSGKDRRVRIFARVLLGEIVAGAEWRPAK